MADKPQASPAALEAIQKAMAKAWQSPQSKAVLERAGYVIAPSKVETE